jgi:hypothetical protein
MANEGWWQCPSCSRVWAPWVAACSCEGKLTTETTDITWSNIFPSPLICLACHTTPPSPSPSLRHTCMDRHGAFC